MKKIIFSLDQKDISRAINEINTYKQEFQTKVDTYRKRIAEEIAVNASSRFKYSIVDDIIKGDSPRYADVDVTVSDRGDITLVIANGEDAVWCEFGAGVYHNGAVGSSSHPSGSELGFTIGSYGKGYGKGKAWGYYEDGELIITRGTPATMPMYNAMKVVMQYAIQVAREVFA